MAEIYGLFSGRDGKVRYVGKTTGSRKNRFEQHKYIATGRYITKVYTWLHGEWNCGFPVRSALLEQCSNADCERIETEWINRFPDLLNERKRYWRGERKAPVIPEIREYMGRFVFNSGGYRGIHWWRELDRYSVFFYAGGDDWRWLPGDGAPGWNGEIWFTHRADALKAREKHRQGRHCYWLRDIEQEFDLPNARLELPDICDPIDFAPSINGAECNAPFESEFAGTIA
jgi:hypothetical protein